MAVQVADTDDDDDGNNGGDDRAGFSAAEAEAVGVGDGILDTARSATEMVAAAAAVAPPPAVI